MASNPFSRPWGSYSASQYAPTWSQQPPVPSRPPQIDPAYANYGYGPQWNPVHQAQPFPHPRSQISYSQYQPGTSQQVFQPARPIAIPQPNQSHFPQMQHGPSQPSTASFPPYHSHSQISPANPAYGNSGIPQKPRSQVPITKAVPRAMRNDRQFNNHERQVQRGKGVHPTNVQMISKPIPSGPRNSTKSANPPTGPRNRQLPPRVRTRQSNGQKRRFAYAPCLS